MCRRLAVRSKVSNKAGEWWLGGGGVLAERSTAPEEEVCLEYLVVVPFGSDHLSGIAR